MEGIEELMMSGGMTCGLSDIVVSIFVKIPPFLSSSCSTFA